MGVQVFRAPLVRSSKTEPQPAVNIAEQGNRNSEVQSTRKLTEHTVFTLYWVSTMPNRYHPFFFLVWIHMVTVAVPTRDSDNRPMGM